MWTVAVIVIQPTTHQQQYPQSHPPPANLGGRLFVRLSDSGIWTQKYTVYYNKKHMPKTSLSAQKIVFFV
ncbi:hypothetical protein B0189_06820 [Moraxella cuniculi]|nr:hypothetical protein B0189_06820 [Moraxella cuniculi]